MNKPLLLAIAATALSCSATSPVAAANLISAAVTGSNGRAIWNTTSATHNYTVFLESELGAALNPNGQAIDAVIGQGNSFVLLGDGWPIGGTRPSDPTYTLTLKFADGATISGVYDRFADADVLTPISAIVGNMTYTMTSFSWDRRNFDLVSGNVVGKGGDPRDYLGQVTFTAVQSAVPEATTWAMMLAGFGMIGLGLRSRAGALRRVASN